ncbi:MAG: magnesium transporter [Actinomycetota bacterium]
MVSLVFSTVGAVAAGVALGAMTGTLHQVPGLLVLLPAANFMRGSIFGAMSSRLGTSIHTGLFESTRRRGSVLHQNINTVVILTFSLSLLLGVFAKGAAGLLRVPSVGVVDLIVISMLGGIGASALVGAFAIVLALAANTYRWDLDSVGIPLITAIGDMVTIPALYLATFAVGIAWVTPATCVFLSGVAVFVTARGVRSRFQLTRRTLRESLPILAATSCLALGAGVLVETRVEHFTTFPAFLVLIPPLLSDSGALAATLSSRLASKLHLGALEPKGFIHGLALLDTSIVLLFGAWVFILVGIGAHYAAAAIGLASPGLGTMIKVGMTAGIGATLVLAVIAYYVAVATYRLGLDPDNHGVPMVTSTSDLTAMIALTVALVAYGLA